MEVLPEDWRQMLLFAEENFAQGGGASPFVSVHVASGEVFGLDVERERSAAFLMNSSIPAFIDTFLLFDDALGADGAISSTLRDRIRTADPIAYEKSEWRSLVDYLVDLSDGD
jgi:hypothetical protein